MITELPKRWRFPPLGVLVIVISLATLQHAMAQESGQEIFEDNCAACHTIGKGKLVGPDLAGVTSRREASWLERQIGDPESLIDEEDPIALQLMEESDGVPMPSPELSDEEIAAVIGYLKSTESRASVETSLPSQYLPTVLISAAVVLLLTLIALIGGRKKVDVR